MLNGGLGLGTNLDRPVQEALGVPARHRLVRRRQVGLQGGVPALASANGMAGDALAVLEDLDVVAVKRTSTFCRA
jgi:hypothetical protein